jgi:hypothetical protein
MRIQNKQVESLTAKAGFGLVLQLPLLSLSLALSSSDSDLTTGFFAFCALTVFVVANGLATSVKKVCSV